MIDDAIEKFTEIVTKACARYAQEFNSSPSHIQIRFALDRQNSLRLSICKDYVLVRDERLSMIMGLKHFAGVPSAFGKNFLILNMAPDFIVNSLASLCSENNIEPIRIFAFAGVDDSLQNLRVTLWNFDQYLKDISLEKLIAGDYAEDEGSGTTQAQEQIEN